MAAASTQEIIEDVLKEMNAVADKPCTNAYCGDCDGVCARKWCGGYTSENMLETAGR